MTETKPRAIEPRVPKLNPDTNTVEVPLHGSERPAIIDQADFEAILAAGYSDQWRAVAAGTGRVYVCVSSPYHDNQRATVARLIMKPMEGDAVRYRDDDTLNLRRSNLFTQPKTYYWKRGSTPEYRRQHPRPPRRPRYSAGTGL
jgi:hypothetical protein